MTDVLTESSVGFMTSVPKNHVNITTVFRSLGSAPTRVELKVPDDLATALRRAHELANHAIAIVNGTIDYPVVRLPNWKSAQDIVNEAGMLNAELMEAKSVVSHVRTDLITANHAMQGGPPFSYDGIRSCAHDIALYLAELVGRNVHAASFLALAKSTGLPADNLLLQAICRKLQEIEPLDGRKLAIALLAETVEASRLRKLSRTQNSRESSDGTNGQSNSVSPVQERWGKQSEASKLYNIPKSRLSEALKKGKVMSREGNKGKEVEFASVEKWNTARRQRPKRKSRAAGASSNTELNPSLTRDFLCKKCEGTFSSNERDPVCPAGHPESDVVQIRKQTK